MSDPTRPPTGRGRADRVSALLHSLREGGTPPGRGSEISSLRQPFQRGQALPGMGRASIISQAADAFAQSDISPPTVAIRRVPDLSRRPPPLRMPSAAPRTTLPVVPPTTDTESSIGQSSLDRPQSSDSSGYRSISSSSALSSSNGSQPKTATGRGMMIAKFLRAKQLEKASGHAEVPRATSQDLSSLGQTGSSRDTESVSASLGELNLKEEEDVKKYHGEMGCRMESSCNWIKLDLDPTKVVYEYEVKFDPQVDAQNVRFKLLSQVRSQIGNVKSFDGAAKLWLPLKLQRRVTVLASEHPYVKEEVKVIITLKTQTTMLKCLQLYNVLFNRIMKTLRMKFFTGGYFSEDMSITIPQHKLSIWPGFVTAVHHMEGGVMIVVDSAHRVLRQNSAYDVMKDLLRGNQDPNQIQNELAGAVVMTQYNKKTYRIDEVNFDLNPQSTFETHDGKNITYIQYYKDTYNLNIDDHMQPLLVHRLRRKELKDMNETKLICLVPELCLMTGLTDTMRADFKVMKSVAETTRLTPMARLAGLRKFLRNVNDNAECVQILADWGLSLRNDTIDVESRTFPPEPILFGRGKKVDNVVNADWGRESGREGVIAPVHLKQGCWLVIHTARDEPHAKAFVSTMKQVTRFMGIDVGDPHFVRLRNDNIISYTNALNEGYSPQLQMAVIIFPSMRQDRYSAVKRLACTTLGLPTQCINSRTISQERKLRSVTVKIALQINCKLGGELWALKIPMSGLMVCGVDVYHDPLKKGNSIVGFVGSLNQSCTRWHSRVSTQSPHEEIVSLMANSFRECLKQYYAENHGFPKSIVVYRDGVGEGQLKLTEQHEIPQLATVLRNAAQHEEVNFYYVIVLKRINTRIIAKGRQQQSYENPAPGTVVDHTITKRNWYDFFLVSQHVSQGTVSPTHYVVLQDSGKLKPDQMQKLTYKMTHLYYNWPGTIRVPAPCMYAHKLAYLIGQSVRQPPKDNLRNLLYYL